MRPAMLVPQPGGIVPVPRQGCKGTRLGGSRGSLTAATGGASILAVDRGSSAVLAAALRRRYALGDSDYWMKPLVAVDGDGRAFGRVGPGDLVIFACRRGDREVQLMEAFVERGVPHFRRPPLPGLELVPLVEYHQKFGIEPLVEPVRPTATLGAVLSAAGLRQLAVSESEKQAHVTLFFNGRRNQAFAGQESRIIPSRSEPQPDMRSREVAEAAAAGLGDHDFVLVNFPAGDVIGHLEDFEAKVAAVRAVDAALGAIVRRAAELGAVLLVTADHGLMENGFNADGSPGTAHTTSLVPFVAAGVVRTDLLRGTGTLADVAPTVLGLLGLAVPAEMTGRSLLGPGARSARVAVVILDGWGLGVDDPRRNPIASAAPPVLGALLARYPHAALAASGAAVGLPEGRAGNSETGHLTIGAGRVIEQDELRLRRAFAADFAGHPRLASVLRVAVAGGASLHLIGLLSEASSHGVIFETMALARLARKAGMGPIRLHLILDGRSSPPHEAADLLDKYGEDLRGFDVVTAVGRGYALDRGGDYSRTAVAYRALVEGDGAPYSAQAAGPPARSGGGPS